MAFGKIDPVSLGASLGILSGISTFFMGLMVLLFNTGKPFKGMMGTIYFTYDLSFLQCLLGGISVAIGMFVGGYIVGLAYNYLREQI